jgi:hypothetical protein
VKISLPDPRNSNPEALTLAALVITASVVLCLSRKHG